MAAMRPLSCEFGVLERADGSARVCQGATSVLAAVYGPVEVKASRERSSRAAVEVVVKPARGQGGVRERFLEQLLSGCCEECVLTSLHPHTAISIALQIVTDQGSVVSTLSLALCLALLDSGLPLSSPFSALATSFSPAGDLVTDPTLQEEQSSQCVVTVVTECSSGHVMSTHTHGACCIQQLEASLAHAEKTAEKMLEFYQQALRRRLAKDAKFSHLNIAI